jgi:hypothetical protein
MRAGKVSQEIGCVCSVRNPEAPAEGFHTRMETSWRSTRGDWSGRNCTSHRIKQETLEGKKPKEVSAGQYRLNPLLPGGIPTVCTSLA